MEHLGRQEKRDGHKNDTAIVFIDPQNEVLSEKGLAWGLVGGSVTENNTIDNMERIFKAAKANGFEVLISPHYFFPTDSGWKFNGPLEADEAKTKMFLRSGRLSLEGFTRSGADWLERFKPYIEDGKTIVVSPHRVFGPQTNDLVLQLRKRRISKVILGGMLANMCVESHLRDLLEQGFETVVAKDATAGPSASRVGVRIRRRAHQLRVSGARGVDDQPDSQGYGAQLISEINARGGHQMSLRSCLSLHGS